MSTKENHEVKVEVTDEAKSYFASKSKKAPSKLVQDLLEAAVLEAKRVIDNRIQVGDVVRLSQINSDRASAAEIARSLHIPTEGDRQ